MTECAYAGCDKPVPEHVTRKGGRFCSTPCRQADHRERGKSISGTVQSVSRCSDGAVCLVLRVPAAFWPRLEPYTPRTAVDVLAAVSGRESK